MLMPKRTKFRKQFRGKMKGDAHKGNEVSYGEYGLQSLDTAWVTSRQIEAARIAMTRYIKRGGKIWIRIFPHKPISARPAETRMGKGKGSVEGYVAIVKPGTMLYEMQGVSEEIAREAMRLAMHKLPIRCKFVKKSEGEQA